LAVKTASLQVTLTSDFEELTVAREPPLREDLIPEGGLAFVRSRYEAITTDGIAGWKRLYVIL
jgi:hypothetical protein